MQKQTRDGADREDRREGQDSVNRIVQQLGMGIGTLAKRAPIPVVVVCRNNLSLTKLAIRSTLAQDHPVELLVVDNCSTDGTSQWLRTKSLTVITPAEQWSLARCWNSALQALWAAGHDRALVINNDVEIQPGTARKLSEFGGEFVTGVSVGSFQDPQDDPEWKARMAVPRPHPDFSCFLITRTCTDRVGWFNESYFPAYCEDSEYHVRMHRAGVQAVCLDVPFLHHRGSTIGHAGTGEVARIRRGADRNRERFRQEYGCLPGSDGYQELFT